MLLEIHLHYKHLSNYSAASGVKCEEYDFGMCKSFELSKYMWTGSTILSFVLGFPACVVILWDIFKTHGNGTPFKPNRFLILNITIMDTIFLVFIPFGILNHFFSMIWVVEAFWNAFYAFNLCGRPLLMTCICMDCYLAVVHPITYHKWKNMTPWVVMVCIIWTWTVGFSIVLFLNYCLFFSFFSVVNFLIAIVIIAICDSFIVHALIKSDAGRKSIHPQKRRAIQTLINSLVVTLFSYLPPFFIVVFGKLLIRDFHTLVCVFGIPITVTSSFGSVIMPILHLSNNHKLGCFRNACFR